MSPRSKALVALVLGVAGMAATLKAERALAPVVTPAELKRDPERYHRRIVKVRGWIEKCQGFDCQIENGPTSSRERKRTYDLWRVAILAKCAPTPQSAQDIACYQGAKAATGLKPPASIGVAHAPWFDARMQSLLGRWVIVSGRFDAACSRPNHYCLDRSSDLIPSRLAPPYPVES